MNWWYGRGYIECAENYARRVSAQVLDNMRVRKAYENDNGDVLEFHPGPKGKSHANTCRMMGDCSASSSSFSAPSRCTGSHWRMSASYIHSSMSTSMYRRRDR